MHIDCFTYILTTIEIIHFKIANIASTGFMTIYTAEITFEYQRLYLISRLHLSIKLLKDYRFKIARLRDQMPAFKPCSSAYSLIATLL